MRRYAFVLFYFLSATACKLQGQTKDTQAVTSTTGVTDAITRSLDTETVIPAFASLPQQPQKRVAAYRKIIDHLAKNSETQMSSASGCADFSTLWLGLLNKQYNYKMLYSQTDGFGTLEMQDEKTIRRDKIHVFVTDRALCRNDSNCDDEIIIDPTYLQFFEFGECIFNGENAICTNMGRHKTAFESLKTQPRIFVGTKSMLFALYQKYSSLVRVEQVSNLDPNVGLYIPKSVVSLIYSTDNNSSIRTNLPM